MATRRSVKKPEATTSGKQLTLPVGKGPISYTTSNVFKASVSRVWAAATEREHLKKHFVDDMKGDYAKSEPVSWYWKEWGWCPIEVVKYTRNKELVMRMPEMQMKYSVTVRFEILSKGGKTIFRVHESGYPAKDLKNAFMMCEGWTEFHTGIKAYLMGVNLRNG